MLIIKDISNLQSYLSAYQNRKYSIGYVPTMGALHKGHGELIKQSKMQRKLLTLFLVDEKQISEVRDFFRAFKNAKFCQNRRFQSGFRLDFAIVFDIIPLQGVSEQYIIHPRAFPVVSGHFLHQRSG